MELKDYQQLALRTINSENIVLSDWEVQLIMLYSGLAGETGEIVDLFKKALFHKHGIDRDKVKGELGDLMWYITNLASHLGMNMNEILQLNINKLKIRYPNGFSVEDSIDRVDVVQGKLDTFDIDWDEMWEQNNCVHY